jgi:hypothetical protein
VVDGEVTHCVVEGQFLPGINLLAVDPHERIGNRSSSRHHEAFDAVSRIVDGGPDRIVAGTALDHDGLGRDVNLDKAHIGELVDFRFDGLLAVLAADGRDGVGAGDHGCYLDSD